MEKLTKAEAVRRHRQMWRWIADETEKRKACVNKEDAFQALWPDLLGKIWSNCWCCEYAHITCQKCPVVWPEGKFCDVGIYQKWKRSYYSNRIEKASKYARQIAELPEREGEA